MRKQFERFQSKINTYLQTQTPEETNEVHQFLQEQSETLDEKEDGGCGEHSQR
jgi:hypothetical protein